MKANKILISTVIFSFLSINLLFAQENFKKVAQSGMQYLKIGVGAEIVGRGEAGISCVKGASAMFWNPAGLGELVNHEIIFSHNSWIADISMNAAAVGVNLENWGVVGFNILWMDYGELYRTAVASSVEESAEYGYVDQGKFSPTDLAIGFAYSKKVSSQFSFGGQIRYLYENYGSNVIVTDVGAETNTDNILSAVSFDFGTLYYPGFESLAFSMTVQHFTRDLKYQQEKFSAPLTFKIGVSMNLLDLYDDNTSSSLLLAVDAIHPRDYSERLNIGLEYDYLGLFRLRGGYRMNYDEGNFTAGAGVRYSISNTLGMRMDVSYIMTSKSRFSWPLQITAGFVLL